MTGRARDLAAIDREARRVFAELQTTRGARIITDGSDDAEAFTAAVLRRAAQLAVELLDEPWTDPH